MLPNVSMFYYFVHLINGEAEEKGDVIDYTTLPLIGLSSDEGVYEAFLFSPDPGLLEPYWEMVGKVPIREVTREKLKDILSSIRQTAPAVKLICVLKEEFLEFTEINSSLLN